MSRHTKKDTKRGFSTNYTTFIANGARTIPCFIITFATGLNETDINFMYTTGTYSLLLADDDSDEIEFLVESFANHPKFKIDFIAKNGIEVVDYLTKNPNSIDIIISDMFMPAMTGLEALQKLTDKNLVPNTLTVIFSNTVNVENQEKFKCTELLKFYTKPCSIAEYEALPEKLLSLLQQIGSK